jgi:hypothetical protein
VNLLGHKLDIDSTPGRGSRFRLRSRSWDLYRRSCGRFKRPRTATRT